MAGDRVWGAGWVLLGLAMVAGASRLDRLEAQGVPGFAAPGLLPALLGIVIAACGVLMALRSGRRGPGDSPADSELDSEAALPWRRVAVTLLLCLGFSLGLVGHGLPFGAAAALYLVVHITILQWHERGAAGQRGRGLLVAGAVAAGAGLAVPFVFEQLFLVRLP